MEFSLNHPPVERLLDYRQVPQKKSLGYEPERDDPYIEEPCGMCNATGLVSFWGSLPDDRQEPVVVCYFCEGTKVMLVENPLYLPF